MSSEQVRGRGAAGNPRNRFERLEYLPEECEAGGAAPRTVLLRDNTRRVLSRNESPDLDYRITLNPYRGCEHGCIYCLVPETPVLRADSSWVPIGDVAVGDVLVGFDEGVPAGVTRRVRPAQVEAVWWSRGRVSRLATEGGRLFASPSHRWLRAGPGAGWLRTDELVPGTVLSQPFAPGGFPGAGAELPSRGAAVLAVDAGPETELVDIRTSTGTFVAAGMATHNCYARPFHEYLGFSAGLDFEAVILTKPEAPALLRRALLSPRWRPQPIALSGVTDPYQPAERTLRLTRGCLEVLAEFRNPVFIATKSRLVLRDLDLLSQLASFGAAGVSISVTTLDEKLQRLLEPRASAPGRRLDTIAELTAAGIPVRVLVAPVVPGLTDHELPAIISAAAKAGARAASYAVLRLPHGVAGLFDDWLARHFPGGRKKALARIRMLRGGQLDDSSFHCRMSGTGVLAGQIRSLFDVACRRAGLTGGMPQLSAAAFRRPDPGGQLGLFEQD